MSNNTQLVQSPTAPQAVSTYDPAQLTRPQVELLKRTIAKGATDDELALFVTQASRLRLDPFLKQIHLVKRWSSEDGETMALQVGIDGFRLMAERTARFAGIDGPYWCGTDGVWKEVWLEDEAPKAAMVKVYRSDIPNRPITAVALFSEYAQTKSARNGGGLTKMWKERGAHMIGKCAEALAMRRAFPSELSGVYAEEELQRDFGEREADDQAPGLEKRSAGSYLLPGKVGESFGGYAGKPLAECSASVLNAFRKWCDKDSELMVRYLDEYKAAAEVLADPAYQAWEKARRAEKAAAKAAAEAAAAPPAAPEPEVKPPAPLPDRKPATGRAAVPPLSPQVSQILDEALDAVGEEDDEDLGSLPF